MNIEEITHGSLFTGLGGFDFAAQRCGIETLWQCENNKFCKKFLDKFFPGAIKFSNIYDFDFEKAENVTIISGGFPCQDISQSGKGAGLFGPQSSKVFAQLEVISKLRPQFAVFENSPVLLVRGLEYILRCLASIGYDAQWCNISASDFGYRHKRERLFVVAYPCTSGQSADIQNC